MDSVSRTAFSSTANFEVRSPKLLDVRFVLPLCRRPIVYASKCLQGFTVLWYIVSGIGIDLTCKGYLLCWHSLPVCG